MVKRSGILCGLLLCAACADQGDFPSLAKRPFEKAQDAPTASPPPAVQDAALASRIVEQTAKAREGEAAFETALGPAKSAVAAAGASGSESWIAAQLAVSRLETTLGAAREALSALDGERHGIVDQGNQTDLAALESAIATVEAIDSRQSEEVKKLIDALNAR